MRHNEQAQLEETTLVEDLNSQLGEVWRESSSSSHIFVRLRIPPTVPLAWLRGQKKYPQYYWHNRDGDLEIAGLGSLFSFEARAAADIGESISQLEAFVSQHPQSHLLSVFAGMKFDPAEETSSEWAAYPCFYAAQPEIALWRRGEEHFLVLGAAVESGASQSKIARRIAKLLGKVSVAATNALCLFPEVESRLDSPTKSLWEQNFAQIYELIADGEIGKVVMARRSDLSITGKVCSAEVLEDLRFSNPGSYSFLCAPNAQTWFGSVSPECFCRIQGNEIHSDALGGTIWEHSGSESGGSESSVGQCSFDEAGLFCSEKLQREHEFVIRDLLEKYEHLCQRVQTPGRPEVVRLSHVQHLRTAVQGELRPGLSLKEVLLGVNPTAAVCGYPQARCQQLIRSTEPFTRGWYSGPVGVITGEFSEFAVALRCALASANRLSLYAGAGVVQGSVAEEEWRELEAKIACTLNLFSPKSVMQVQEKEAMRHANG